MNKIWEQRKGKITNRENDERTAWERDYARLIHSAAFRRLQSKTQVLGLGESDFYRTRLTHSMEVAQIGTGILNYIKQNASEKEKYCLPDSILMNAICLAHDIGHPPFGHGGEVALNYCMQKYGGFEGNGQTLRIITKLEKYSKEDGLNATRRMLLGILKYPLSYNDCINNNDTCKEQNNFTYLFKANDYKPPKCFLDSEKEIFDWIIEPFSDDEKIFFSEYKYPSKDYLYRKPIHKSLDTSIMELADDISYGVHDLEDAISLGMITRDMWDDHIKNDYDTFEKCDLKTEEISKKLFSAQAYERKDCIGNIIHKMIINTKIKSIPNFENSMLKYNVILEDSHEKLRNLLHKLVSNKVIESANVQLLEFKGQKLIVELFQVFKTDPMRFLPQSQKARYEKAEDEVLKMRIICDYLAGMTDDYATRLYEKIFNTRRGSVFDRL